MCNVIAKYLRDVLVGLVENELVLSSLTYISRRQFFIALVSLSDAHLPVWFAL